MPQTTTIPTTPSSIIARYNEHLLLGAKDPMLYSQSAIDFTALTPGNSMDDVMRSSSMSIPFQSGMAIGTNTISQTTDLTPQNLYDATVSVSKTSRGEALQFSQQFEIETFNEFTANAFEIIGRNVMETIESVAQSIVFAGTYYDRYAARSSLDAGTSAHRMTDNEFRLAAGQFASLHVEGWEEVGGPEWAVTLHPWVNHDIQEGGKVVYVGEYQNDNIILNWQLGKLGRFKIVESPYAKVFYGAGAAHDTANASTVGTASTPLATTLVTAGDISTSIAKGRLYTVGTIETSTTMYPMNERFRALSAATTTITLNGFTDNGGLKYAHAAGETVTNADSVYTAVFTGPKSLCRIYDPDPVKGDPEARAVPGVPGAAIVGPQRVGSAHQWNEIAWKWWGNYKIVAQKNLYRYECSVSYEHST